MSTIPLVSVLMPVYNGELYLRQSIESILSQSWRDFEFIIIDDGSTDATPEILRSYSDKRIIPVRHARNQGLISTLNHGLGIARGCFIARQDADDISLPNRLATQLSHLTESPQLSLVGCAALRIAEDGSILRVSPVEDNELKLRWLLLFQNQFVHTSIMFKRSVAKQAGGYASQDLHAEDYGLWSKMALTGRIGNINMPLVKLRIRGDSITRRCGSVMLDTTLRISLENISYLTGIDISVEPIRFIQHLKAGVAKTTSLEQLEQEMEQHFSAIHHSILPTLLRCFSSANRMADGCRGTFEQWARRDMGISVLSVANSHVERISGIRQRRTLIRLCQEAIRICPGLLFNRHLQRVIVKIGIGSSFLKRMRRLRLALTAPIVSQRRSLWVGRDSGEVNISTDVIGRFDSKSQVK